MIREGDDAIPLVTTRRAFGNQETSKQRSAIVKIVHSKHFFLLSVFYSFYDALDAPRPLSCMFQSMPELEICNIFFKKPY